MQTWYRSKGLGQSFRESPQTVEKRRCAQTLVGSIFRLQLHNGSIRSKSRTGSSDAVQLG
eukprot:2311242-Pleurochrysis_carterae.AAC.1